MAMAQQPARRPVWLWPAAATSALHVALWWACTHQGLIGGVGHVATPASASQGSPVRAMALLIRPLQASSRSAAVEVVQPLEAAVMPGHASVAHAPTEADAMAATTVVEAVALSQSLSVPALEASALADVGQAGPQWLRGHYAPSDVLERSPQPELGWLLDEDALTPLQHGRMVVQVWVSAEGRIDRAELLQAEPPGDWAEQALRPLPGTPMLPGQRDGRAVPATIVVELMADNEHIR